VDRQRRENSAVLRDEFDSHPADSVDRALAARWQLVFGVILLAVVVFFENGVTGGIRSLGDRLRRGLDSGESATGDVRGEREGE
jgi:hypothetical protein